MSLSNDWKKSVRTKILDQQARTIKINEMLNTIDFLKAILLDKRIEDFVGYCRVALKHLFPDIFHTAFLKHIQ